MVKWVETTESYVTLNAKGIDYWVKKMSQKIDDEFGEDENDSSADAKPAPVAKKTKPKRLKRRSLNLSTSAGHEPDASTEPRSNEELNDLLVEMGKEMGASAEAESERRAEASDKRKKAKRKRKSASSTSATTKSEPKQSGRRRREPLGDADNVTNKRKKKPKKTKLPSAMGSDSDSDDDSGMGRRINTITSSLSFKPDSLPNYVRGDCIWDDGTDLGNASLDLNDVVLVSKLALGDHVLAQVQGHPKKWAYGMVIEKDENEMHIAFARGSEKTKQNHAGIIKYRGQKWTTHIRLLKGSRLLSSLKSG